MVTDVQSRFNFTETIVVCAGEEQKEFVVHKNVLATSSSKFLNRMLSNEWRETREKRLSLPETRPEVLEVYLHWMYTGIIVLEPEPADASGERRVELYFLGDYLDDMSFCEAIFEGLVKLSCGLNTSFLAHWQCAWRGARQAWTTRYVLFSESFSSAYPSNPWLRLSRTIMNFLTSSSSIYCQP